MKTPRIPLRYCRKCNRYRRGVCTLDDLQPCVRAVEIAQARVRSLLIAFGLAAAVCVVTLMLYILLH